MNIAYRPSRAIVQGSLEDLSEEHFTAAERAADRRCFELSVVCEVPLFQSERALVVPWMICEKSASGQLHLPRLSAPDIISLSHVDSSTMHAIRRQMKWLRLIDILCGRSLPRGHADALLLAFISLHGLPRLETTALLDLQKSMNDNLSLKSVIEQSLSKSSGVNHSMAC